MRYDDIDPMDIDPDTGRPYSNYSSPALDTSLHDGEMGVDDEDTVLSDLRVFERALVAAYGEPQAGASMQSALGADAIARVRAAIKEREGAEDDDIYPGLCTNPEGHEWPRVEESERCLCVYCGADGDA
jgi:hypothetical protein